MTFLESCEKRRLEIRRKVHKQCQKIISVGGNGGKYYIPKSWTVIGRSIQGSI